MNWHLYRKHIVIPKTANLGRLKENHEIYDFNLTEEEYQSITALDMKGAARFFNPIHWGGSFGNVPYFM